MPPIPGRAAGGGMPSKQDLQAAQAAARAKPDTPENDGSGNKKSKKDEEHHPHSFIARRLHAPKGHHDALEVDFNALLQAAEKETGSGEGLTIGKYVRARQMLRRAQVSKWHEYTLADEENVLERADERFRDEAVGLSSKTGAPTLSNPTRRQMELTRRGLELRRDKLKPDRPATEVEKSVYRSHVAGEIVCVGEDLPIMPQEVANTLTMQFGLRRIYMPRNELPYFENYKDGGHHFSARHMAHVEEIDMQHNHAFSRLPDDVGQMVKLTRLCLQHTAIFDFPPSFLWLTNLKHLDLTHCAFKYLPDRFGAMASLEYLNLRSNMLIELPPTFFHLKSLKMLDLSSNGMAYLAIKPFIDMESPEVSAGWEERIDPGSKKKYYHNTVTGVSQKAMPDCLKKIADMDPNSLFEGTRAYNEKKKSLAGQGIYEWEAVVDQNQGAIYYQNNVNGSTVWDMPEQMDTFGRCFNIETFKCNDNLLRDLPESMSLLTDLRLFECKNNYLGKLPLGMGELTALKVLRLPQNEIKFLPESMSNLAGLTELVLTSNQLSVLPQWMGDMTGLRHLLLGNNRLEALPYKLGYCTDLAELQVYNNPLEDPPYETVLSGMRDMLWYLRQQFLEVKNGPKPIIKPHFYGINDEKVELAPIYQKRIERIVESARETNELDLIQNGLRQMPDSVNGLPNLKRLNLTAQHMVGEEGYPVFDPRGGEPLTNLTTLWLKRCELSGLDESIGTLRGLTELDVSENQITDIPKKALRHLKKLVRVNLMKNHLYDLPDAIGNIGGLKELNVDMNRLDLLPPTFQKLRNLEVFSASFNNLYTLPDSIGKLENLRILGLEGNQLCRLPPGLGYLHLEQLKVSHNRLERLELDLMAPNLQDSIQTLLLSNNNLLELPAMFDGCSRMRLLQIDYNPMRSPPTDLLEEGMHVIIQYCRIRSERVKEVVELLEDYGFEIEPSHFTPTTREALTGNTGFLTPEDLDEFDAALDAFLNGKYYECPVTCADLVDKIDALRHERQYIMYNLMLQELLAVMRDEALKDENIAPRKEFSTNVLQMEVVRPWGRKGEDVFCYAVTLDVLLKDTMPNDFVENYRESLFEKMKNRLPVTVFTYTPEMLKDAINDFEGPYGKVCMIEKCEFEVDEYIDDNGRARRKNPCVLPSLVITRIIYTASEARRRQEEDEQYWAQFKEIEGLVDDWLESKIGKKRLTQETRRRHRMVSKQVRKVEESKRTTDEELSAAREELGNVKDRKRDFDEGKAFHEHQITSLMDALRLVDEAEKEVDIKSKRAKELNSEVAELHCKLRMKKKQQIKWATNDLKRKYCHLRWQEMLLGFRQEAMDRGYRRPWDGVDGQEFEEWVDRERLRGAGVALPDEIMSVGENTAGSGTAGGDNASQATGATPASKNPDEEENEVKDDFDWDGCDKIHKFMNDRYQAFLAETRPFALRNPWDKEEDEAEAEEEDDDDGNIMDALLSAGDELDAEAKAKKEAEQLAKEQEAAGIVPRSGGTPSTPAKTGL